MPGSWCCIRQDSGVAGSGRACEYYGCVPKLAPLDGSTLGTSEILGPSVVNVFTGAHLPHLLSDPQELPPQPPRTLRVVVISDTHERHREMLVPRGDLLVHGGDIQEGMAFGRDGKGAVKDFFAWFNDLDLHPHPAKVVIGGNHDKVMVKMSRQAVRAMADPALYLEDESAVLEPLGLRIFGSPRSTANSRLSPNEAWQSAAAWKPFRAAGPSPLSGHESSRRSREEEDEPLPIGQHTPLLDGTDTKGSSHARGGALRGRAEGTGTSHASAGARPYALRLEGEEPHGPVDILLTHQSPEFPEERCPLDTQPIVRYVNSVNPCRVHLGGHLHGSHGLHRIPVPPQVAEHFGYVAVDSAGNKTVTPLPFLPSINASMLLGSLCNSTLQPASVIDLEI